jgi:hypothetical protein
MPGQLSSPRNRTLGQTSSGPSGTPSADAPAAA